MINRTYYRLARVLLFISLTASQLDICFGCVCHLVTYLFLQHTLEEVYYRQQRLLLNTGILCYIEVTANEHVDLTEWLWFFPLFMCISLFRFQRNRTGQTRKLSHNYCWQAEKYNTFLTGKKAERNSGLKEGKPLPPSHRWETPIVVMALFLQTDPITKL